MIARLRIPPAGDPQLDEYALNDCLGVALIDICSVTDWPWLLTSTPVTFTAGSTPMPATAVKVRDLIINDRRAQAVSNAAYFDAVTQTSRFVWTVLGTNIQITPVPTVSPPATLWFVRQEPALTGEIATPLIPEAHQSTLLARACYQAEVRRGRPDAAAFHDAEYDKGLMRMRDAMQTRTGPRQIRERGQSWWARW
jgi:hypothetical protein